VVGERASEVIQEADEIAGGQGRIFGILSRLPAGDPAISPAGEHNPLDHWTTFEGKDHPLVAGQDIRLIWEAGRLGWIYPLARAYRLTGDDRYPQAFWQNIEAFLAANPPNRGPHWSSGQEVAVRLVGLAFGGQVFARSAAATPERRAWLAAAIADHARRIPPTLIYARAQNNNHLVTEALGLYTAGVLLPDEQDASGWRKLGWRWLNHAFQKQIRPDGTYVQHSTNYHRLVLQAALWAWALSQQAGDEWPIQSLDRLRLATHWLYAQLDPASGRVPNLGANDSAYLFPLAAGGLHDYRPVLQACGRAFLGVDLFPPGVWDEMSLWFGLEPTGSSLDGKTETAMPSGAAPTAAAATAAAQSRLDCPTSQSWASLRAVHYHERPSHSDPLHVELWWRGQNLALDAGTYSYNADPPWDNALVVTRVHNTIQIDGQDPMLRAGKFLWLDWAQARFLGRSSDPERDEESLSAEHSGYARLGVIHERTLSRQGLHGWQVIDRLKPVESPGTSSVLQGQSHRAELVWLLPDWPWDLDSTCLRLESPYGWVQIDVEAGCGSTPGEGEPLHLTCQLIRAGEILAGGGLPDYIRGWYSPTYGQKQPALTWCAVVQSPLPFWISTLWLLPE